MFKQGTVNLTKHKDIVDSLNVFPVPDGDTGTNMSLTMNYAVGEMLKGEYTSVSEVAKAISKGSLMGARGNSGVILSQIFRGFAKGCEHHETLGVLELSNALIESARTAYKAVLKPVEGTILTVIREIGEKAEERIEESQTLHAFFEAMLVQGELTLKNTPNLLPQLKQAGVVDAGGKGLMTIFTGFYEALLGKEGQDISFELPSTTPVQASINPDDIHFTYCTEFIVRGDNLENADLKNLIVDMGDSMVYVPDEDLIKVHIHTNDPGLVMQEALKFGELIKIKIENMKEQHGTILDEHHVHEEVIKGEKKAFGFVAVAMGEGLADVYRDLKVDYIIEGGQTMNPSTEDIKKAIDQVHAEHVFILPNNSNIILAANQAKELSEQSVFVLPTKTVLQGISAMLAFDPHHDAQGNFDEMLSAISDVKSIQVTYAVRDTVVNDIEISTDDYLGILDNQIVASAKDMKETIFSAMELAVDDMSEIVTVYYGEDVSESDAKALAEELEERYEDIEFEVYPGKQPIYYYLISVE
ncbi:DAK2 domain-containing protein [Fusibacter sp. A1]|nr:MULTISPECIES: DAK2 domain-containing protein [unclassified Fusibacter]NPE20645.1 DAK2 domain-containing protein [Fusibacter sp. A1]RXV63185.1 DAK2 domain-containing protein [Fusibacter sp. A1]